jgi:hypothetical protein
VWGQNDSKDTWVRRGRGVGVVSDFRLPLEWVAAVVVDFDWELVLYNNRHRVSLSKHTFSFQSSPCVEDQSKRAAHHHQWKSIYTCCSTTVSAECWARDNLLLLFLFLRTFNKHSFFVLLSSLLLLLCGKPTSEIKMFYPSDLPSSMRWHLQNSSQSFFQSSQFFQCNKEFDQFGEFYWNLWFIFLFYRYVTLIITSLIDLKLNVAFAVKVLFSYRWNTELMNP